MLAYRRLVSLTEVASLVLIVLRHFHCFKLEFLNANFLIYMYHISIILQSDWSVSNLQSFKLLYLNSN